MTITRTTSISLALAALALAPAGAVAQQPADDGASAAKDGGSNARRVSGHCSRRSTSKLKVKPDNGRLETEFEVDQNRNGVTWRVTLRRNGRVAYTTSATTRAPSGSFSVSRRLPNGVGSDRISARATSPTGEVCTAVITI